MTSHANQDTLNAIAIASKNIKKFICVRDEDTIYKFRNGNIGLFSSNLESNVMQYEEEEDFEMN